jgi:hypothetical protein
VQAEPVVERLLQIHPAAVEPGKVEIREFPAALILELLDIRHAPGINLRRCVAHPVDERLELLLEDLAAVHLFLRDAGEGRDLLADWPILRLHIALERALLRERRVEPHGAELYDLIAERAPHLAVITAHGIHLEIHYNVIHLLLLRFPTEPP